MAKSLDKTYNLQQDEVPYQIVAEGITYSWSNNYERIDVIRKGLPYESIERISDILKCSIKEVLSFVGIPQTTYNKKKNEHAFLDSHYSELLVLITEFINYGLVVFNYDYEKFHRWMKKPNLSLGGAVPESFLDTISGIQELKSCLNRLEFGNFA